tara:strand:- start:1642 stop:1872 length:231 start_codon:yes stop_codon:yes gene_type:complete
MTKLIKPTDSRYFKQTSDESYDRHTYELILPTGRSLVFQDYEHLRAVWFEAARNWSGCIVNVLGGEDYDETKSAES